MTPNLFCEFSSIERFVDMSPSGSVVLHEMPTAGIGQLAAYCTSASAVGNLVSAVIKLVTELGLRSAPNIRLWVATVTIISISDPLSSRQTGLKVPSSHESSSHLVDLGSFAAHAMHDIPVSALRNLGHNSSDQLLGLHAPTRFSEKMQIRHTIPGHLSRCTALTFRLCQQLKALVYCKKL